MQSRLSGTRGALMSVTMQIHVSLDFFASARPSACAKRV